MPINQESFNSTLYDLLKTRGYKPTPINARGENTPVPQDADVFKFDFIKQNKALSEDDGEKNYGPVWATIDNASNLIVYYDDDIMDSGGENTSGTEFSNSWPSLLKILKRWAMRRQLGFELKNRDHLGSDMAQREHVKKKEALGESYYPIGSKASYNDSVPQVKIIIQHTRKIEEGEKRFHNIERIFVENTNGETFAIPTKRPGIAKVYARHVAEGGSPYDERGKHITSLVEEYTKMAGFVRAVRNGNFNESAQKLIVEGINHYHSLRETLSRMIGHRGYNAYFESWTPTLMETEQEESSINELFVKETLDPRIESAMPILRKLTKNIKEVTEVDELAEWADAVVNEASDLKSIPESGNEAMRKQSAEKAKRILQSARQFMDQLQTRPLTPEEEEKLQEIANLFGTIAEDPILQLALHNIGVSRGDIKDAVEKARLLIGEPEGEYVHEDGEIEENFINMVPQAVAEGSLNESDKFTSWYDWKDQAKSSGYTITRKDDKIVALNKQGQVVGHWSDVGKFLSGKAPRPNFKRPVEQGVKEGSHNNIMSAWNSGMDGDKIVKQFGQSAYDSLKRKYGSKSIPVPDLHGYRPTEPTDSDARIHRGLDGPGKQLKLRIAQINKQGVAETYQFKKDSPLDVDMHYFGDTDNVETNKKSEWKFAVNRINARVFDDNAEFSSDIDGEEVRSNGVVWAEWDNKSQIGWYNIKGRPLKTYPMTEQGVAEGSVSDLDQYKGKKLKDYIRTKERVIAGGNALSPGERRSLAQARKELKELERRLAQARKELKALTSKNQGVAEGSGGNWYIRVNGKILNDTKFKPVIFSSKDEARSHAMKLADKERIPLSQIKLTKSWMDAPEPGVAEGLDANQKRAGQLGPTEKVGKNEKNLRGKLVGAESVENDKDPIEEGKLGKVLGGLALLASLLGGNEYLSKRMYDADPQLQKLIQLYDKAKADHNEEKMKEYADRIEMQKNRLDLGKGPVRDQYGQDKEVVPEGGIGSGRPASKLKKVANQTLLQWYKKMTNKYKGRISFTGEYPNSLIPKSGKHKAGDIIVARNPDTNQEYDRYQSPNDDDYELHEGIKKPVKKIDHSRMAPQVVAESDDLAIIKRLLNRV